MDKFLGTPSVSSSHV